MRARFLLPQNKKALEWRGFEKLWTRFTFAKVQIIPTPRPETTHRYWQKRNAQIILIFLASTLCPRTRLESGENCRIRRPGCCVFIPPQPFFFVFHFNPKK